MSLHRIKFVKLFPEQSRFLCGRNIFLSPASFSFVRWFSSLSLSQWALRWAGTGTIYARVSSSGITQGNGPKSEFNEPFAPPKINFQSDLLAGGSVEPWDPRPCLWRPGWRCVKRVCLRNSYKETISPQLLFVPHVSSVIFVLATQRRILIKFLCAGRLGLSSWR